MHDIEYGAMNSKISSTRVKRSSKPFALKATNETRLSRNIQRNKGKVSSKPEGDAAKADKKLESARSVTSGGNSPFSRVKTGNRGQNRSKAVNFG